MEPIKSHLECYSGYLNDNSKLLESSSGGMATALAECIIKANGVVFGVEYSEDFKHTHFRCIENLADIDKIKGTKYCETQKKVFFNGEYISLYKAIEQKLLEGRIVLFFGLGCDCAAVRAFFKEKSDIASLLYCVEILCHGPVLEQIHRAYIEDLEKKYGASISFFSVRYKKKGWTPPYLKVVFTNGRTYEKPFLDTDYGVAFGRYSRVHCYNCSFRGENHRGDMTIGDCWGLTEGMSGWNKNGVSVIIVQTSKGKKLIDMLDSSFHIDTVDADLVLKYNPMYTECREKPDDYDRFIDNVNERGLHYAILHMNVSSKWKVAIFLKNMLPDCIISTIKSIKRTI